MILSFRVMPGTTSSVYATGDKVYFKGDRWTGDRSAAKDFPNIGQLLRAFSIQCAREGILPDENLANYSIEERA